MIKFNYLVLIDKLFDIYFNITFNYLNANIWPLFKFKPLNTFPVNPFPNKSPFLNLD